jgi:hypothetical protein
MDLLQNKYRLEDAQTEPMISLTQTIIGQNTLRYVVGYKDEESQNQNCLQEY